MKKRFIIISVVVAIIISLFIGLAYGIYYAIFDIKESPNGDYQIVSWWIDQGAAGYAGAYYIKEKGIFSKWHKLGDVPFGGEWISEKEFLIQYSSPIDGDWKNYSYDNYHKKYNVDDFFKN